MKYTYSLLMNNNYHTYIQFNSYWLTINNTLIWLKTQIYGKTHKKIHLLNKKLHIEHNSNFILKFIHKINSKNKETQNCWITLKLITRSQTNYFKCVCYPIFIKIFVQKVRNNYV